MKTALITGANKGIGYEVARQLASKGFHVFVGARNAKAGRKAAEEMGKKCHARSATALQAGGVTRPTEDCFFHDGNTSVAKKVMASAARRTIRYTNPPKRNLKIVKNQPWR